MLNPIINLSAEGGGREPAKGEFEGKEQGIDSAFNSIPKCNIAL